MASNRTGALPSDYGRFPTMDSYHLDLRGNGSPEVPPPRCEEDWHARLARLQAMNSSIEDRLATEGFPLSADPFVNRKLYEAGIGHYVNSPFNSVSSHDIEAAEALLRDLRRQGHSILQKTASSGAAELPPPSAGASSKHEASGWDASSKHRASGRDKCSWGDPTASSATAKLPPSPTGASYKHRTPDFNTWDFPDTGASSSTAKLTPSSTGASSKHEASNWDTLSIDEETHKCFENCENVYINCDERVMSNGMNSVALQGGGAMDDLPGDDVADCAGTTPASDEDSKSTTSQTASVEAPSDEASVASEDDKEYHRLELMKTAWDRFCYNNGCGGSEETEDDFKTIRTLRNQREVRLAAAMFFSAKSAHLLRASRDAKIEAEMLRSENPSTFAATTDNKSKTSKAQELEDEVDSLEWQAEDLEHGASEMMEYSSKLEDESKELFHKAKLVEEDIEHTKRRAVEKVGKELQAAHRDFREG
ncbi:hypothetical protein B0T17DRAFT_504463 [Bombardia bombarda]|uniref:Uncharacterized protein n=1 Tax=Bombardia bombarda TaxID=252184 RepID=A0AA40CG75_9PEZI|nr:hypothetical protein B0T17DRAFT_504463 [Bombardia bombarda]